MRLRSYAAIRKLEAFRIQGSEDSLAPNLRKQLKGNSWVFGCCRKVDMVPGLSAAFSWWFTHPYLTLGGVQLPLPVLQHGRNRPKGPKLKKKR